MVAVSELETEYEGRINFRIIAATSDEGVDATFKYDFKNRRHGLVGLTTAGEAKVIMPGHAYGKPDIVKNIEELLR